MITEAHNRRARILVVEDDQDIQEALTRILENEGYAVSCADNGAKAIRLLREGPAQPCVILLDLMMPVMDGWQFRRLQKSDPSLAPIPVIVLSAHGSMPQDADLLDATSYLKKPIDLDLLLETVKRFCSRCA